MATCLGACWQLFFWRTVRRRTRKSSCSAAAAVCLPTICETGENIEKVPSFFQASFTLRDARVPVRLHPTSWQQKMQSETPPQHEYCTLRAMNFVELLKKKKKQNSLSSVPWWSFQSEKGRREGRVACRGLETRPSPSLSFIFKSMSISMSPSPPPAINMMFHRTGCMGIDAEGERERALRGTNGEEIGN